MEQKLTPAQKRELVRVKLLARRELRHQQAIDFTDAVAALGVASRINRIRVLLPKDDDFPEYQAQVSATVDGQSFRAWGYGSTPHDARMDAILAISEQMTASQQ